MAEHPIGVVADYPEGVLRGLEVADRSIAVIRLGERFYAFDNFCTHEGVTFTAGYGVVAKNRVVCMLHSSAFDVESGAVLAGPAPDPLATYDVEVCDGAVLISVPD